MHIEGFEGFFKDRLRVKYITEGDLYVWKRHGITMFQFLAPCVRKMILTIDITRSNKFKKALKGNNTKNLVQCCKISYT